MSAESKVVTLAHFQYLAERTRGDDEFLVELKQAAAAAGIPRIWISPEQASFMQILLKLIGAENVIEVGTLAGYSAIQMARALPAGGRVRTLELVDAHADFTEEWVSRSDVAGKVEVMRGNALEVLPTLADGSADAAFIDADKSNYSSYLKECMRIVRPRGLLMVDNAFAFGQLFDEQPTDGEVDAVRAFNEVMAKMKGLHGIIAPIGDGCWVAVNEG